MSPSTEPPLTFHIPEGRTVYPYIKGERVEVLEGTDDAPDYGMFSPQGDEAVANLVEAAAEAGIVDYNDPRVQGGVMLIDHAGHVEVRDTAVREEICGALEAAGRRSMFERLNLKDLKCCPECGSEQLFVVLTEYVTYRYDTRVGDFTDEDTSAQREGTGESADVKCSCGWQSRREWAPAPY